MEMQQGKLKLYFWPLGGLFDLFEMGNLGAEMSTTI